MPRPIDTLAIDTLAAGDIVEIQYRLWRGVSGESEAMVDRWLSAHIVDCERGAWPLARLADGQVTEIRPFMIWRPVFRARAAVAA